ncbi:hypothetical protein FRX31_004713 [Thalictrum thalictroides]|uniref:Uncharacterized protein n=1 Tax=Thalictrum thalictroides TaxID=46969 RepID=A0A7J6XB85_THATH|nr:hypothetical protein FRX31_004713 [Thalictrum thalictroides]
MSRSMVLVFLLLILIITSQFDWKQQIVSEIEATPSISNKNQHYLNREESIKEKRGIFRDLMSLSVVFRNSCNNVEAVTAQEMSSYIS